MKRCALLMMMTVWCCVAAQWVCADGPLAVQQEEIGPDDRLLVLVNQPAELSRHASLRLGWMNGRGERLHDWLVSVDPGAVDLGSLFAGMREHRGVSFVQLFVDGRPYGSAVVIQPILEPIVPRTVDAFRADGTMYPRIVGWRTQREIVEMDRVDDDDEEDEQDNGDEVDEAKQQAIEDRGRPAAEALADPSRRLLGYRLYVERDVSLDTSFGEIRIVLQPDHAPETTWNFRRLVAQGFYNGLTFHRVVPMTLDGFPFVIQGGCPRGDGTGDPGYAIHMEPSSLKHDFGVVSMARGDEPDSAGSQFFIALSRDGTAGLDGQYCAFGFVVAGGEALVAIEALPLKDIRRGVPRWPTVIHEARLVASTPRETGVGRMEQRILRPRPTDQPPMRAPGRIPR